MGGDPWLGADKARRRRSWLTCVAAWVALAGPSWAGVAEAQKLSRHSISAVPDINTLAVHWSLAGTVIPNLRSLVLSPGVPNRTGILWSQTPLLTNDFEVAFSFTAKTPESTGAARDDGFAFWVTYENGHAVHGKLADDYLHNQDAIIAGSWQKEFLAQDLDLLFYRSKFDGLGIFFLDDTKQNKSTVSAVFNKGQKVYKIGDNLPVADALKVNFRGGHEVTVKLRVQPKGAKLDVPGYGNIQIPGVFKPGAYIGFTTWGGTGQRTSFVELRRLEVTNFDKNSKGEEEPSTPAPTKRPEGEKEDILRESSVHKVHREESEAIKDVTNMVFKLLIETQPVRAQIKKAIQSLSNRIDAMERSYAELSQQLEMKTGAKLAQEFESIKQELSTLSSVAFKDTEERHKRLGDLHADIAHVHKAAKSAASIDQHLEQLTQTHAKALDQLTAEHQTMFGVSLAAIAFVLISGFSLYNKFRCWEKKHVL